MGRGYLSWDQGYVEEPLELFRQAGALYREAGCPTGAAHAAASEAWAMLQLGNREEAAQLAREMLEFRHADPAWPPTLTDRVTSIAPLHGSFVDAQASCRAGASACQACL